jgi:hypothetical protein
LDVCKKPIFTFLDLEIVKKLKIHAMNPPKAFATTGAVQAKDPVTKK